MGISSRPDTIQWLHWLFLKVNNKSLMITFVIKSGGGGRLEKDCGKIVNKGKAMRQDDLDLFVNRALKRTKGSKWRSRLMWGLSMVKVLIISSNCYLPTSTTMLFSAFRLFRVQAALVPLYCTSLSLLLVSINWDSSDALDASASMM